MKAVNTISYSGVMMCGIASIFDIQRSVSKEMLSAGLSALVHRGPDGFGQWISNNKMVGLGHSRLAIMDVSGGKQPVQNEDGSITAVVNGEFYDHDIWVKSLQAKGHLFRTSSDSEILVHLYEEFGIECVKMLNGEFAFIIWDSRKNLLVAGRDRFGIKPLLWSKHKDKVILASEAKALFSMGVPAVWDRKSFYQMSSMQYLPSQSTLFSGVKNLAAGHLMLIDKHGDITQKRYWDLDFPSEFDDMKFKHPRDACKAIRLALEKSVKRRVRSEAPVATQLSGGIDSSIVAALAAKEGVSKCFSIAFNNANTPYDERDLAQATANDLGLDLEVVSLSNQELAASLYDAVEKSEGIAINAHLPAKYFLSKVMRNNGYKVALTGEGADELFLGYPHFRVDWQQESRIETSSILPELQASSGIMLPSGNELSTNYIAQKLGFVPSFLRAKAALGWKMKHLLKPNSIEANTYHDPFFHYLDSIDVLGQLKGRTQVNQSRYLWSKSALTGYILQTLGDGTEMAHSVEGRVPFLDYELYETIKRIPHKWLFEPMQKQVLRDAVKGLVPEPVRLRKKHPFIAPPVFMSAAFITLAKEVFNSDSAKHHPFIDTNSALNTLERLPSFSGAERIGWDASLMMSLTSVLIGNAFKLGDVI